MAMLDDVLARMECEHGHCKRLKTCKVCFPAEENFMTTRQEVYEALDSEREYQEGLWNEAPRTPDEFALYVNEYASRLQAHCTDPSVRKRTGESELDFFRKVGALCVAAMEQHGAPKRI